MNQKKLQRNLYKHFPRLQEDYKFVSMAQTVQKNQQTTEKTPNLVMKKGQKKK